MQCTLFVYAVTAALSVYEVSGIRSGARSSTRQGKNRPVSKVITLLKDMQKQLEKDALADEETYKKMACWCTKNEKATSQAIAAEELRVSKLSSRHQAKRAEVTGLQSQQNTLEGEVNRDEQALESATSLRTRQLTAFHSEERDLVQSIQALKAAITVLSKHQTPTLVQLSHQHKRNIATALEDAMKQHGEILDGALTSEQRQAAMAFMAASESHGDFQPQSGQIYGVLQQMLESFEKHLAAAKKEETSDQRAFGELENAKEAEITAGQTQVDTKGQLVAAGQDRDAQYLADRQNTQRSLEADRAFLQNLRERCLAADREWEERQSTRTRELRAITSAIQMLATDNAQDLFSRTFNPAFVQTSSSSSSHNSQKRERASSLLKAVAERVRNPRLSALAGQVKLDAFTRVKKAIDDMVTQLLKEKKDEINHKDFCVKEFAENEMQNQSKHSSKRDTEAQVEDIALIVQTLESDLATLRTEISTVQVELRRAGEDREKENQAFQATVRDQRETVRLLQAAHSVLSDFYGTPTGPSLLQGLQTPGDPGPTAAPPPPPDGFQAYKKQGSSRGVLDLILVIIQDAKAVEAEAIRSESDAQRSYEEFVKQTNTVVDAKSRELVEKSEAKAEKERDLVELNKDKDALTLQLEQLANAKAQLHSSCDFVMQNFDVRQTARDDEIEGLRQAKAILSGASFQSFLQKS